MGTKHSCACGNTKRKIKLSSKLSKSKKKIKDLKVRQPDIVKNLGSFDSQIVDDGIRDVEKQWKELVTRVDKRIFAGSATDQNVQDFNMKIDVILSSLEAMQTRIAGQDDITYLVSDAQDRITELKNLEDEIKKEEGNINQLNDQGISLMSNLASDSTAHQQLQKNLSTILKKYSEMLENVASGQVKWNQRLKDRTFLQKDMDELNRWLQNKETDLERFLLFGIIKQDVERQKKNCQKLLQDVETFHPRLKNILKKGHAIGEDCCTNSEADLSHKLSGFESRYGSIKKQAQANSKDLRYHFDQLCKFQAKCNKLRSWCNETEIKCSTPLHLDCATSILRNQFDEYQKLSKKCKENRNQLPDMQKQSEKLQTRMSNDDKEKVDEQMKSLEERTIRIDQLVCDRLDQLESALSQQDEVDGDMNCLSSWLELTERQVTPLKSIGNSVEEAKKLHEQYQNLSSEFKTKEIVVAKLGANIEKLTSSGQTSNVDTIQRILTKYSLLNDQVVQMQEKCLNAVSNREHYAKREADLQAKLDQCRQRIDKLKEKNIPATEKLDQYKIAYNDVQEIEKSLSQIIETAHQIDLESSNNNGHSLTAQLQILQGKINSLKISIDQEIQDCERKELEGKEISKSLDETIQWLELRIREFSTRETLELNLDKLNYTRQKQEQLFQEVMKRVNILKTNSKKSQNAMGDNLKQKLTHVENLHEKTKSAYQEKEKYISDAMSDRRQLEQSMKQVTAWVNGAEKLLECRSVDDSDHRNLLNQLDEIKEYLSEASLCQDEMEIIMETSSRMIPSLDATDKMTLEKSLKNIKGRQEAVMSALQDLQDKMEARIDQWNEFHGLMQDFETVIQDLQNQWVTIVNGLLFTDQNQISQSYQNIVDFVKTIDNNKALVDKINKYGNELDIPESDKESVIYLAVTNVNDQWNSMKTQTQEKLRTLSDISSHWECVNIVITEMNVVLQQAEHDLLPENIPVDITSDDDMLIKQIEMIETIKQNLKPASAGIVSLKESANALLQRLPTAEAKVHSQDQILLLNERFERLEDQCDEYLTSLLEEKNDRKSILSEIEQTMEFLEDTQVKLHNLANSSQDGNETDRMEKQKKLKLEMNTRIEHIYSLIKIKQSKYKNLGIALPASLTLKLERLTTMQKLITDQENLLQHLGNDREKFKQLKNEIRDWLTEAYLKLKRRIKDVDEDMIKHKELLLEFESLRPKLANLRSVGDQIIQNSPDNVERQKVHIELASLNKHHASLQVSAASKSQQLEEAEVLVGHFNEAAKFLECWLDQAAEKTNVEIEWDNVNLIKQQFQIYKKLSSELVEIQIKVNHLNSTVKHLRQTCDANGPLAKVSAITQHQFNLNGQVDSHLPILEDANMRISNFESQLKSLHEWLVQTQQKLQFSEPSLTIQDSLLLHEKILEDIERQRRKADDIVKHLPSQMLKTNFHHPQYVLLINNIDELHSAAKEHHCWILEALQQQEANNREIEQTNAFVGEERYRLTQPFNLSDDSHSPRKGLSEHSASSDFLRHYQEKLRNLQEQNRILSKMAVNKRIMSYGQHFPIQSHGVPQISTSTPRNKFLKDSGVSLSTEYEKSLSFPFLPVSVSELSWSPSNSVSFEDLSKTLCSPSGTESHQLFDLNQNQRRRLLLQTRYTPTFRSRNIYSRRGLDLDTNQTMLPQRIGARRKLFDLHSLTPRFDKTLSQSLPDIRSSYHWQNGNSWLSNQTLPEFTTEGFPRTAIHQPCFNAPNRQLKNLPNEGASTINGQQLSPEMNVSIQHLSSKIQFLNTRLSMQPPATPLDIQHYINEHKDLMQELVIIKKELNKFQVLEKSKSYPQGYEAMHTTLSILTDRVQQLEAEVADRDKKLQEIVALKEKHFQAFKEYTERFATMEKWLQEKQIQLDSSQFLLGQELSVENLLHEIEENKQLQACVYQKMKELSDMAVQCDRVCELEPHDSAEDLRTKLVELQKKLAILKLNIVRHLNSLCQAVKEAQVKQKTSPDYETGMQSLEKWFSRNRSEVTDNKENYHKESKVPDPKHYNKQQEKLHSDFSEHRKLLQTLSMTLFEKPSEANIQSGDQVSRTDDNTSQDISWRTLYSRVLHSKQSLLDFGQAKPLALHFSSARYLYNGGDAMKAEKSATQTRYVEKALDDLNDCWKKIQILPVKDPKVFVIGEELKKALMTISDWLDHFETCLFTVPPKKGIQQKLKENAAIRKNINDFQERMKSLLPPITERLNQELSENDKTLMNDTLTQVKDRMLLLTSQIEIHADDMNTWKHYEEKITKLRNEVTSLGNSVSTPDTEESFNAVIGQIEDMESQLKELETSLFKSSDENHDPIIPNWVVSEFTNLQFVFMNAKRQIMDKKANFLRISSIQTEYEKILKDYSDFLTTAENKLKIKKLTVRDFDHLKQQLGTYKDFFSDMESYQVLLDSLVKNCSEGVCEQYRSEHARLSDCTDHVQGLANLHGQQLSSYVNQWNDFNTQFDKMMLQIKEMNKRCHSLSADLDSGVNLSAAKDIIKNCQETQEQLTPDVFQALDQGKQILHNVNSASLEAQVTTLANEWSQLHFFTSELSKRLEEVYDKIEQYKNQMAIWSTWLERSKINLATLRNLQEDDASNISVIRNKMEKLLEFRKDIDNEAVGKNKLIFIGYRLQHSHPAIAAKMNINVDQIEEQWAELKHDIGRAEQTLHQAQMELLPSRQALNELITFINKLQNIFKEDKKKPINKMNKVGPMLNKYKKFKIEMENKALTMDFVNQCVLKPNDDDDDSASALEEKKDFARRLSKLQQDWAKVEEQLNSQLNGLSLFEDKWEEFDQFQKNLANWFSDMEEKIKKRYIIGMEVNVKHTLKECQILQEKAVAKESDIDHLKALGNQLLELELAPTGSQKIVKEKVDSMQKKWQAVCKHLQQQMKHLQDVLEKWNEFSTEKAFVLDLLAKLEYYLSNHSNFIPGNYYSIKMQLSKMKAQSEEIQQESKKMEHLTKLSTELCQVCETPIKQDIQKSTSNIQNRWKTLTLQLKEHIELLEYLVERLKIYNEKYQAFSEELAHMEKSLDDMLFNYDNNQVERYWKDIQDLQDKLDIFQSKLSELYQLSDDMGPNLDTVSVVNITSQQATLEERLLLLRHSADRFHQQMTDIRLQLKNFEQSLASISSFLQRAETILQNTNIQEVQSLSAEEALPRETLIQFKELLVEFNVNATSLDSLNELGYRMALDAEKVQQLQDLNHKWYQLQSCVLQHCHCLQESVLLHQNFTEKCTAWMSHLAEIENLLAEDIGGSFEELLNQQKKYQTLTSELTNKQQLLHAIIADGQKMQTVGDATDSDFENNLKRLSMQWQNVVKRINQRKTTVDNLISTWKNFNDQTLWFDRWLEDKESTLRALDIDMASMRCKLNIMEKVKNIENEFKMQDDRYNSLLDVSQKLLQYTSGEPETNLLFRLKNLQDKRASVIGALDLQTSKLQTTVKQWELCDKQVEELLAWLRDMHNISGKVLPTSYDELEAELHRCQDLQVSCSIYEDKYQVLFVNVNQLNHIVQPEDVSLLQQRMKLWHKQWTELCVQLDVRILQVKRKLEMWPQYSTDVNKFCTWCEQMEDKVRTMNGHNIETMLAKFEEEYECELNAKEQEKDSLIHQGEALQKCSSEVHSSDIALRSQQVEQKWQHLQAIVSNRKHKLKETLQAMQQFDRDTDNLRKWLQQMEDKLHAPLVYTECDYKEIDTHLEHQKDMQKDIERHSAGVSSVLNLCEVLLHDSDACRTDKESAALNNTKNTLEKRWQVICKLSTEREASIKETGKQLQCFMTLYNDFSAWLDDTEKALQKYDESSPESKNSQHRYYQEIQRKISEKINQLENLKKQYEILVKGGFTDCNGSLEKKVQEANNRWEELSRKVQNITKITKKNIVSWEEYHNLHKALCDWLNDVDSRIREFEKSDNVPGKSECLKKIQEQQKINSSKFKRFKHVTDQLLNETGDTQNSRLQIEVDEFYDLHDWVIGRLNSLLLPADQYPEDIIMEEEESEAVIPCYMNSWTTFNRVAMEPLPEVEHDDYTEIETYLKSSPPVSPPSQRRDSSRYAVGIPYSVNKEEWWLRFKEELSSNSKEALDAYNEEMLNALEDCAHKLIIAEEALRCHTPVGPELDHQTSNYIKIMADCQASVENVQRVYTKIKNELGLMTIVTVEQEVSNVTSRWKRLRSCIIEKDLKLQNNRKDWSQFNTDLDNINKWLKARDNWLNSINVSELSIPQMGGIIKELKDFQDELKSKQTIVESLKLTGGIFCEGPLEENQLTKRRLQMMHIKWGELTARCSHLVGELRRKLSESDYFHEEVERMLIWINQMETKVQEHQPHNIDQHENNVQWQYDSLQSLKSEIKQQQGHISALKETSRHLHKDTISPAVAKSKDDIHIIAARAHSLLQQIMTCLNILESRLDFKKTLISRDVPRSSSSSSPPCSPVPMADSNTILINDDNVDEVDEGSWTVTGGIGFDQEATSAIDSHQALKTPLPPEDRHVITSSVDYKPMSHEKTRLKPTEAKDVQFDTDDDELFLDTEEKVEAILKDDLETEKPCEILEDDETDVAVAGPCTCSSFCRRVFWIALPIQGLLLLLLGLASLLPMTEDDYSCALTNNMQRSFTSVLHYVNGPPPV